jgi:hypothetical protein
MFGITSYLHKFGTTEDGEDFVGEVYFIVAELEDGTRYSHFATFPGATAEVDEEHGIPYFPDRREEAMAEAENLLGRIEAELGESIKRHGADCLNPDYWTEVAPAYGSRAYIDLDMEGVYAELERREG